MITTLRCPVIKLCPYADEVDSGELTVTIPGEAPELHALAWAVHKITLTPVTHEDFTRRVLELLPEGSAVLTTWQTGPWSVEVREGPGGEAG